VIFETSQAQHCFHDSERQKGARRREDHSGEPEAQPAGAFLAHQHKWEMNGATPAHWATMINAPTPSNTTTNGLSHQRRCNHRKCSSSRMVPAPPAMFLTTFMTFL